MEFFGNQVPSCMSMTQSMAKVSVFSLKDQFAFIRIDYNSALYEGATYDIGKLMQPSLSRLHRRSRIEDGPQVFSSGGGNHTFSNCITYFVTYIAY